MLDFLSIFHERPDQDDQSGKIDNEVFNCCSRSTSKPNNEDRVFSPRGQTPWIREGYAPSGRQLHCSANDKIKSSNTAAFDHGCDEDISLLKAEIREVVRAIDEGERRIRILETTACPKAFTTSQQLANDLKNLRVKSSDLSAKLMELEMLTTPRHN